MFAALAVEAKDKLGLWSSRVEGASGACFLFCYFCGENAVLCRSEPRQPSLFKVKMAEGGGVVGERMVLAAGCRCRGLAGLGIDVCLLGQKQLGHMNVRNGLSQKGTEVCAKQDRWRVGVPIREDEPDRGSKTTTGSSGKQPWRSRWQKGSKALYHIGRLRVPTYPPTQHKISQVEHAAVAGWMSWLLLTYSCTAGGAGPSCGSVEGELSGWKRLSYRAP